MTVIPISDDPSMEPVIRLAMKAASCRANVLLEGESGVGKAFIAEKIHEASQLRGRCFCTVFCLPDVGRRAEAGDLVERIKNANRGCGTVYVRGIDLLSPVSQRRLLTYLDGRERRSSSCELQVGRYARLIFSSQKDLRSASEKGHFSRELYLRVSVITIEVPPLRQRETDIISLARHFLSFYSSCESKKIRGLTDGAERFLRELTWEGNIHELKNAMNSAVVLAEDDEILSAQILKNFFESAKD